MLQQLLPRLVAQSTAVNLEPGRWYPALNLTFFVCHVGPPQKAAVPPLGQFWPIARILARESGLCILPLV